MMSRMQPNRGRGAVRLSRPGGGVLQRPDFRLIWLGETTSSLGSSISRLALPLVAVVTLDAGTFAVAVLAAASWLPWLVVGLPAGAWVDRVARRPLLLVCNAVSLVFLLSVPVVAAVDGLSMAQLYAVALITGTANVFFQTGMQVYLPGIVPAAGLGGANAALHGSESVAQVAGPSLAGLIAHLAGAVAGLIADALSFLVSSVCLLLIRTKETRDDRPVRSSSLRREILDGIRFVRTDPYLRVFTAFGALSNVALTGYQSILVVFLVREVGVGPGILGLLISGMSIGGVLGAAFAGVIGRRLGTARGMLVLELAGAPFALLIPLADASLALVVVGGIGVGAGIVGGNVINGSFRQAYTPRLLLGRVVVTMQFLNYGAIPAGALLAGALGTALGLRPTMWLMAAGVPLASLVLLLGPIRRHRDLPDRPAMAVAA
jgi:MFS family permease